MFPFFSLKTPSFSPYLDTEGKEGEGEDKPGLRLHRGRQGDMRGGNEWGWVGVKWVAVWEGDDVHDETAEQQ